MANKNNRRRFLTTLGFSVSAAIVGAKTGFSLNKIPKMSNPVKSIEALGFQWKTQDPFLFCVHHEDYFPKGNENMGIDDDQLKGRQIGQDFVIKEGFRMYHGKSIPGFPYHPHRGFETITVVRTGLVDHSDSLGAAGRYGNGDVQWMTAGKGVQHAEMFPLLNQEKDNPLELFQIWLNLPKSGKFADPHFKMLWSESIPNYEHIDSNGKATKVEVIAGSLGEYNAPNPPPNSWAATKEHEVAVWNIKMEAGAKWTLPKAKNKVSRSLYFYNGENIKLADVAMQNYHAATLDASQDVLIENGNMEGSILILQGKAIGEPVVQYGPFVMNSKQEIQQAFEDFQKIQFGGWPWDTSDPVHGKTKGRFALHANGREEKMG